MNTLTKKLKTKNATVGVIGLGYVGLPLCLRLLNKGLKVIGIDHDENKILSIKNCETNIINLKKSLIKKYLSKKFILTKNYNLIKDSDFIIICVPTPIRSNKKPDMKYISNVAKKIAPVIRKNQVIVLESTVYPGATEEYFLPIIKKAKLKIGINFFLGFSPEREDPGNKKFSISKGNIPKIVSGYTNKCKKLVTLLYSRIAKTVKVNSIKEAEFTKLLENVYRAINISFVNEMKVIANGMNIDINNAIDAAKTKPFGFTAFYPGPGLGGHCIPVDPHILAWKAKKVQINAEFIKLSSQVNENMSKFIIKVLKKALLSQNKSLKNKKILILGISYKKNSNDMRESPAMRVISLLKKYKCDIFCVDPLISGLDKKTFIKQHKNIKMVDTSKSIVKKQDAVILITDHDKFNYKIIKKYSKLIIDTRNKFKSSNKIFKA